MLKKNYVTNETNVKKLSLKVLNTYFDFFYDEEVIDEKLLKNTVNYFDIKIRHLNEAKELLERTRSFPKLIFYFTSFNSIKCSSNWLSESNIISIAADCPKNKHTVFNSSKERFSTISSTSNDAQILNNQDTQLMINQEKMEYYFYNLIFQLCHIDNEPLYKKNYTYLKSNDFNKKVDEIIKNDYFNVSEKYKHLYKLITELLPFNNKKFYAEIQEKCDNLFGLGKWPKKDIFLKEVDNDLLELNCMFLSKNLKVLYEMTCILEEKVKHYKNLLFCQKSTINMFTKECQKIECKKNNHNIKQSPEHIQNINIFKKMKLALSKFNLRLKHNIQLLDMFKKVLHNTKMIQKCNTKKNNPYTRATQIEMLFTVLSYNNKNNKRPIDEKELNTNALNLKTLNNGFIFFYNTKATNEASALEFIKYFDENVNNLPKAKILITKALKGGMISVVFTKSSKLRAFASIHIKLRKIFIAVDDKTSKMTSNWTNFEQKLLKYSMENPKIKFKRPFTLKIKKNAERYFENFIFELCNINNEKIEKINKFNLLEAVEEIVKNQNFSVDKKYTNLCNLAEKQSLLIENIENESLMKFREILQLKPIQKSENSPPLYDVRHIEHGGLTHREIYILEIFNRIHRILKLYSIYDNINKRAIKEVNNNKKMVNAHNTEQMLLLNKISKKCHEIENTAKEWYKENIKKDNKLNETALELCKKIDNFTKMREEIRLTKEKLEKLKKRKFREVCCTIL